MALSVWTHWQRPLLKGVLFWNNQVLLQPIPAVRVPGGLTPP